MRAIAWQAAWLPEPLSQRSAGAVGIVAQRALFRHGYRRTAAIVEVALGESPAEARRVSRERFRRLCGFHRDYGYLAAGDERHAARLADRVTCPASALSLLEAAARDGAPLVLVTLHAGGTLRGLLKLARAWPGCPGIRIVKQRALGPEDARVYRHFASAGLNAIPLSPRAGLRAAAALRAGYALGIALDWPPSPRQRSLRVPFLGRDADLCAGPALLALWRGATLVPAALRTLPDGRETVWLEPPIQARILPGEDRDAAALRITRELARCAERWIRADPADWLLWPALPRLWGASALA